MHQKSTSPMVRASCVAALFALAACAAGPGEGAVELRLAGTALTGASAPASVVVTVSAADLAPFSFTLAPGGARLGAHLGGVPAGASRSFRVDGYDSGGALACSGAIVADVPAGGMVVLAVLVQEVGAPPPSASAAPVIEQVALSRDLVAVGGQVSLDLRVRAFQGGVPAIAWSATCGSFDDATRGSPVWTAPGVPGSCDLAVAVSDLGGSSVSLAVAAITVTP
jgi:hypothetical protein